MAGGVRERDEIERVREGERDEVEGVKERVCVTRKGKMKETRCRKL